MGRVANLICGLLTAATWCLPHTVSAQPLQVQTVISPNSAGVPILEERGLIRLNANSRVYEKRFLIRFPDNPGQWNERLIIGVHGGSGGALYSRTGSMIETSETALDDVVADHATSLGYAYASLDRQGIGGTREGLGLVHAFADQARLRIQEIFGRRARHVYLVGFSAGGAIARFASEEPKPRYDGILIVAGAGGTMLQLERQAKLASLWPDVDPVRNPHLDARDAKIVLYSKAVGTSGDARKFWSFVGAGQSLGQLRRTLESLGLTGLSDKDVLGFRIKNHDDNEAFMSNIRQLRSTDVTGKVTVPTIEVVGTYDDVVLAGVKDYKDKVQDVSRKARFRKPIHNHRLYQVEGVWHISVDDDALQTFQFFMGQMGVSSEAQNWLESGGTYIPTVEEALAYLDRWISERKSPPSDQTVRPSQQLKK